MQRPSQFVITTNTTTAAYPLDRYVNAFAIAASYSKSTMTATCNLQQSYLDPYQKSDGVPYVTSYDVSGAWWSVPGFSTVAATSAINLGVGGNVPIPRAIRMITSNVSGGSVTLTINPIGMDGN